MNSNEVIEMLISEFPFIKDELAENDHLEGLSHPVFSILFLPHIIKFCEMEDKESLKKLGVLLEKMECEGVMVQQVVNVSVLEDFIFDAPELVPILAKYLGDKTLKDLKYWIKRYKLNPLT